MYPFVRNITKQQTKFSHCLQLYSKPKQTYQKKHFNMRPRIFPVCFMSCFFFLVSFHRFQSNPPSKASARLLLPHLAKEDGKLKAAPFLFGWKWIGLSRLMGFCKFLARIGETCQGPGFLHFCERN